MNEQITEALRLFPYGIAAVTTGRGGVENALTVSWMTQVSFDPPMFAISIDKRHYSEALIRSTRNFVVNLLKDDQRALAGRFSREAYSGEEKLEGLPTRPAASGTPILEGALAYVACEVDAIHPAGDHWMILGKVEEGGVMTEGQPLTSLAGLSYRKSAAAK